MQTKIKSLLNKKARYEEKFEHGWMACDDGAEDVCPAEIKTLVNKCPDAEIVVFGDETIGIQVNGKLWAAQQPNDLRGPGKQRKLKHETWQWLNWVSGHTYTANDGEIANYGDTSDLRLLEIID